MYSVLYFKFNPHCTTETDNTRQSISTVHIVLINVMEPSVLITDMVSQKAKLLSSLLSPPLSSYSVSAQTLSRQLVILIALGE